MLLGKGHLERNLDRIDQAHYFLFRALSLYTKQGEGLSRSLVLFSLGQRYSGTDGALAQRYFEQATEQCREVHTSDWTQRAEERA